MVHLLQINLSECRKLFMEMAKEERHCQNLISITQNYGKNYTLMAYHGAAVMTSAQYAFWPFEQLKRFNQGKKILENAIRRDSSNVEIRWIRYVIQKNAPAFLNYSKNLEEDKKILLDYINNSEENNLELKILISKTLE